MFGYLSVQLLTHDRQHDGLGLWKTRQLGEMGVTQQNYWKVEFEDGVQFRGTKSMM